MCEKLLQVIDSIKILMLNILRIALYHIYSSFAFSTSRCREPGLAQCAHGAEGGGGGGGGGALVEGVLAAPVVGAPSPAQGLGGPPGGAGQDLLDAVTEHPPEARAGHAVHQQVGRRGERHQQARDRARHLQGASQSKVKDFHH